MQPVMGRSDEIGSLARVFFNMTVQVFSREEQLETLVSERTQELQTSNQHLRIAQEAIDQDLEMAKVVQAALVRGGNVEIGPFSAYARMTPAQRVGGDFVDILGPSGNLLFFVIGDVSGKGVAAALFMAASQGRSGWHQLSVESPPRLPKRRIVGCASRTRSACSSPACSPPSISKPVWWTTFVLSTSLLFL